MKYFSVQLQQVLNLLLLLVLGKLFSFVYLSWGMILLLLCFALLLESSLLYMRHKTLSFVPLSPLATAMGVILMMFSSDLSIYLFVIALALLQKYFIRIGGKHLFNPSNFALMMGLLFFYQDAHIVLGQLGDNRWLGGLVIVLGVVILYRVDRWVIPLLFSVAYILLQYTCIVSSDPVLILEEVLERFYSISFIVFILFMLTDPLTTPERKKYQALFALMVASVSVVLDYLYGFRVQHVFMSLFLLSTVVPLWTQWQGSSEKLRLLILTFAVLLLALSAIIIIEIQPPYYFEMDGS